jgi:hypothetical protein
MINSPVSSTNLSLLLPKVIWLEQEYFEWAREMSNQVTDEAHRWQVYLNSLALLSFEEWLRERIPDKPVNRDTNRIGEVGHLRVGEFKLCLIATEHLLDEVVNVPQDAIEQPEEAAHFYVVLEVLEEEEEVIIRGILRYDQLVNYRSQVNLQPLQDGYYQLPLSEFDAEPNHLLFYCRKLEPTSIPLPITSAGTKASEKLLGYLQETRIKLSQWLQGAFDESWQAIDAIISPEANLALSTRNVESGAKRGKLIDLGMQLRSETVALLVTIVQEAEEKLGISIQLHPTGGERYLPSHLKLTLLSKAGKTLQEVQSRSHDNYIQLKPFKGEPGKRFSIEVSLSDVSIKEDFEL